MLAGVSRGDRIEAKGEACGRKSGEASSPAGTPFEDDEGCSEEEEEDANEGGAGCCFCFFIFDTSSSMTAFRFSPNLSLFMFSENLEYSATKPEKKRYLSYAWNKRTVFHSSSVSNPSLRNWGSSQIRSSHSAWSVSNRETLGTVLEICPSAVCVTFSVYRFPFHVSPNTLVDLSLSLPLTGSTFEATCLRSPETWPKPYRKLKLLSKVCKGDSASSGWSLESPKIRSPNTAKMADLLRSPFLSSLCCFEVAVFCQMASLSAFCLIRKNLAPASVKKLMRACPSSCSLEGTSRP
mmetsp:Transcript_18847/g.38077  ORF Transcript_18847/g.38077 Transcript_18847/m.38077 type:complete len:294 (+) Transcript_18847:346-1227(+)